MAKKTKVYGIGKPFEDIFPVPVQSTRVPTTADKGYDVGQVWINTSTDQSWFLTSVTSGSATWALASPGASDVDTINSLSPTAGNIIIDGGTNITDSNAGSTVTLNLDAAITLATSVTAPLFTSAAGMQITPAAANDLSIDAATGQDVIMKLGDNAGANKFSVLDSDSAEVFAVDSNGGQTYTTITASGLITGNASATILTAGTTLTLAADNSADAVILGGGTSARAITIGQDAAAHTVAIGQAAAGAITIDTAAGVSIDAATASNFSVSGALADLTLASSAGRVIVNGEEAAANAVTLLSAAGGIDADAALQINIDSSQAAATAIRMNTSNAAGGIDIDSGTGGIAVDSTGAISLDAAAASNFTCTGAFDLSLISTAGSVIVNGEEAAVDAIQLQTAAGGIDVNSALEINIDSSEAAVADAIRIVASAADGGIDIDAGTGGIAIDSTGAMSLNGAAASDFTVTGAFDLTLASSAGSVVVNAAEAVEDAILLNASNAAGGITLQTGGGDITISNTVKEVNAEFLYSSGTDLTVSQSPIMQSNATTGVAPTGTTGAVNLMYLQDGCLMEQFILGAGQTIIAPRMTANGLDMSLDQTVSEGAEYNFGARNNAKHAYTIGTSAAFFIEAKFYVTDYSGCAPLMIGFRKVEANNATFADYTDYAAIGINQATSALNATILTELNSGGQTATDTTDALAAEPNAFTVKVLVSAAGVTTFEVDGSAASVAPSYTFDNTDVVMPFVHFLHGADVAGEVSLQTLKIGFQA
jgi:hypothetical protein